ncbi:MAG TPA: hypothetical protein VJN62_12125 [Gemmatimonadales bacterium]|nr:hypothetical protein [Gemmatimonadales bacterium]
MTRTSLLAALLAVAACAGNRGESGPPSPLRGYDIVIRGRDSLSLALRGAFARAGFTVRDDVRGGGGAAGALVWWRYVDQGRGTLEAQVADTRRGQVLAVATIPADTLAGDISASAELLVRALLNPTP